MTEEEVDHAALDRYLALLADAAQAREGTLIERLYPDDDVWGDDPENPGERIILYHARHKYPKHLELFAAGATFPERAFIAANRIGKTLGFGGYETGLHLTGLYPHWWEGRRFKRPVRWWAIGKTAETTRDIVQTTMLGPVSGGGLGRYVTGSGIIPRDRIGDIAWKAGAVANLVDFVKVRHASGGMSTLGFKNSSQGRGAFEGTAQHGFWCDEEPPEDVYEECLIRTATTNGIGLLTFTPLEGISEVVQNFLGEDLALLGKRPGEQDGLLLE